MIPIKCPVCKTECFESEFCPECGFDELSPYFLSKEEGEEWHKNVVLPWRKKYWESLDDFEIEDSEITKYHGDNAIVVVPYGIERIGKEAFADNENIREILFPDTVKVIGKRAFCASNLQSAVLPHGLELIETSAFRASDLIAVVIPVTCKEIWDSAFEGCYNLKTIHIAAGVEYIGHSAFGWCSNVEYITIPSTVSDIGARALSTGSPEMKIFIDPRNKKYTVINNCLIDKEQGKIISGTLQDGIPSDADVSIIGEGAYQSCKGGDGILVIPPNIVSIEKFAFCASNIQKVYIPKTVKRMGYSVFYLIYGCTVFCEAKRRTPQWENDWCNPKTHQILWDQKWNMRSGIPELILLDNSKYTVTIVSYSYDEDEDQLKMQLHLTNRSDTTVRFVVSKLLLDKDPCRFTHWGTVNPSDEILCNFKYDDNEFSVILISETEEISLEITVKDDNDQYEFAKSDLVSLPGFYVQDDDDEDYDDDDADDDDDWDLSF